MPCVRRLSTSRLSHSIASKPTSAATSARADPSSATGASRTGRAEWRPERVPSGFGAEVAGGRTVGRPAVSACRPHSDDPLGRSRRLTRRRARPVSPSRIRRPSAWSTNSWRQLGHTRAHPTGQWCHVENELLLWAVAGSSRLRRDRTPSTRHAARRRAPVRVPPAAGRAAACGAARRVRHAVPARTARRPNTPRARRDASTQCLHPCSDDAG